jgi:hypothetical protein
MESQLLDPSLPQDVEETVRDLQHKSFRVETEVAHSHEVKLEWPGRRNGEPYVLLTSDAARRLADRLRRSADLSGRVHFRESVVDVRGDELCVFTRPVYSGVVLCVGECLPAPDFHPLGEFEEAIAVKLAVALEAAASVLDRAEAALIKQT